MNIGQGRLLAAANSGLYARGPTDTGWHSLSLPTSPERVVDICAAGDSIYVLTRSHLLLASFDKWQHFDRMELPAPLGYRPGIGLFRAIWDFHSGALFGLPGRLIVDVLALSLVFFTSTGLLMFLYPKVARPLKSRGFNLKRIVPTVRFSTRWHNKLGVWFFVFLAAGAATGTFLRPPLLLTIVRRQIDLSFLPGMEHHNPWHDKLRRIAHHPASGDLLLSTSDGFYRVDRNAAREPAPLPVQPPVSVMGVNVFENLDEDEYDRHVLFMYFARGW